MGHVAFPSECSSKHFYKLSMCIFWKPSYHGDFSQAVPGLSPTPKKEYFQGEPLSAFQLAGLEQALLKLVPSSQ